MLYIRTQLYQKKKEKIIIINYLLLYHCYDREEMKQSPRNDICYINQWTIPQTTLLEFTDFISHFIHYFPFVFFFWLQFSEFDFFSLVNLNLMLTDTAAVAAENDDDTKQKKNV